MKRIIFLLLFIMLPPLAIAGDNPNPRPFWGTFSGETTFPFVETCLPLTGVPFQTESDTLGKMTHMGRTEMSTAHCATADGAFALFGMATMTAANGDEVMFSYTAQTIAPPPLIVQVVDMVITGGSGRFEKASGELTGHVYIEFQGFDDPSWPLKFVMSGWIVY